MLTIRRVAGAFVAVAIGVALVAMATLLLAAGRPQIPDRLAGAAVIVQSPGAHTPVDPFPPTRPWSARDADALATRLAAVPGVTVAVPDRTFYMQAIVNGRPPAVDGQRQDTYEGHGWSSGRLSGLRLSAGVPPQHPGDVVIDRALGLPPGAAVTLLTATGPAAYTVTGVVDAPGFHVADEVAGELSPGVRVIGLVLAPGADAGRVAAAARSIVGDDGRVLTGDERGVLEPRDDARSRWIGMQVLSGTAALAGFVTIFVVASTFAFTVAQRRRELGLLRAIGATPRQVRRMVQGEALVVGVAGSVTGLMAGVAAAPALGRLLVHAGFEPATFTVRYSVWPIAVSLAAGPVVALVGAWSAARRAAGVRPLEALREAAVEHRPMGRFRWIVGGWLLAAGVALGIGTAAADDVQDGATFALYGAMALVAAVTLLAPAVVPPIARLCRFPGPTRGGAIGMLVREDALTAARRTASTAAPVLLTVAFAVLVSGMVRTTTAAYAAGHAADVSVGWVIAPDRTPGLSDAAVAGVPGAALLPTTVFVAAEHDAAALMVLGVDPVAFVAADRALNVVAGSVGDLQGDDTVVVTASARRSVGEEYPVVFADGKRVALRVVAVAADGSLPGDLLVSRAEVRRHDASALTSAVYVREPAGLPAGSGARVIDVATWAAEADQAEDQLVWLFTLLLIGVSAGYGMIAVAGTLLLAAVGRAPDLRVLRLTGATRRQVIGFVAAESALVVLIGAVLGGVVAFVALLSIRAGLSKQVGAPVELVMPWPVIGGVVGLCLLLAVVAGVVPARRALRDRAIRMPE